MLQNLVGGMGIAFGILGVIAVADVVFSYVSPSKSTLTQAIESKTGLKTGAV